MAKYKMVKKENVKIESLIKRNFSESFMKKIYDIYIDDCMSIVEKTIRFDKLFTEEFGGRKDYRRIGEGTNRFVCLLDNHVIKVAYNYLAYIDNMNELAMAKNKPVELAQAYETNGIILVSEYVTVMDKDDFLENQLKIQFILSKLQSEPNIYNKEKGNHYILGDMGMSNKNYGNWGRRMNGAIVVLDYGYLYEMQYKTWTEIARCPICGSTLEYTDDYTELICTGDKCDCKVKYTTLRNNLGYAEIIKNIRENINNDKYIKFDKNGFIDVEVMEKVMIEDEVVEEFKIPEEYQVKLDMTMSRFFDLSSYIKRKGFLSIDYKMEVKNELFEERGLYDEVLFPMLIGALELNSKNVESFLNDFNKKYTDRYNTLYNDLQKIHEAKDIKEDLDDLEVMYEDPDAEGFEVENHVAFIDKLSSSDDEKRIVTSLDDILSAEIGTTFADTFMADDNMDALNKVNDDEDMYSLDQIMNLLANEINNEDDESKDEDDGDENIENILQERYNNLHSALTSVLSNIISDFEDIDFIEGDIYRTYLNGDCVDWEYRPEVNASNILGGWKPDEFAFPLYRHMLIIHDYDTDEVTDEYEAKYRIGQDVTFPEDMYDKLENRNIVIDQILNRFETNKPRKMVLVNNIGHELNLYYEALDKYYENIRDEGRDVDINDPSYYFENTKTNTELTREIEDAKDNLNDDLCDQGLRLKDMLEEHKLVYYYDTEYLYNQQQEKLNDIIKKIKVVDRRGNVVDDIKDRIINAYYKETRSVIDDSALDCFVYGPSYVVDCGTDLYKRTRKPVLKAKLVDKESTEDTFKPQIFTKDYYTRLIIEQRYETVFKDTPEDKTKMQDVLIMLNNKDLYYHKSNISKYNVRTSKDNLRYLLTEKEVELLNKYQEMYGYSNIKDTDKAYALAIVELLAVDYEISKETNKFLHNLATKGLSTALSERAFIINVLEINGVMNRLDYLNRIK